MRALNLTYVLIAVDFSAFQNITILFLPAMAMIHQQQTISSSLMIPKLKLVTGIFFT